MQQKRFKVRKLSSATQQPNKWAAGAATTVGMKKGGNKANACRKQDESEDMTTQSDTLARSLSRCCGLGTKPRPDDIIKK